jgi:hypothetical protein
MHWDNLFAIDPKTGSPVEDKTVLFCVGRSWGSALAKSSPSHDSIPIRNHMDGRSNRDMTCLLLPRDEMSEDVNDFVQTQADSESCVITLKTKGPSRQLW